LREGSSKRETTREELSKIYEEAFLTRFEQVPVFQSWIDRDIDEALFWSYVRGVSPGNWGEGARGFPTETVLREMGLVVKLGEELIPTVAGLLLFGLNERVEALWSRAEIILSRYSGNASNAPLIEQVQVRGNLLRQFDGALNFISRYADLWESRPSRKSIDERQGEAPSAEFPRGRANYHRGAIIEALSNMLAHRDWGARERQARINIFDESIEFINPALPIELPIISLRYGVAVSPNPRMKAIFTNRHYGIPAANGGLPMIFHEMIGFA
jgi:predicted HTH transcriptional regulator